jgi:hypothetical protein
MEIKYLALAGYQIPGPVAPVVVSIKLRYIKSSNTFRDVTL